MSYDIILSQNPQSWKQREKPNLLVAKQKVMITLRPLLTYT